MSQVLADDLDRLADELLRAIPKIRAAAKALRNGAPREVRVLAKKARKVKKAAKKVVRKAARKASKKGVRKAMRTASRSR